MWVATLNLLILYPDDIIMEDALRFQDFGLSESMFISVKPRDFHSSEVKACHCPSNPDILACQIQRFQMACLKACNNVHRKILACLKACYCPSNPEILACLKAC